MQKQESWLVLQAKNYNQTHFKTSPNFSLLTIFLELCFWKVKIGSKTRITFLSHLYTKTEGFQ